MLCCLRPSCRISDPSHRSSVLSFGKTNGSPTSSTRRFRSPRELTLCSSSRPPLTKLAGRPKVSPLIVSLLRTPRSLTPALATHSSSTRNCRDRTGSRVRKAAPCPWCSSPRNAAIINSCSRYPLIIDPQLQGQNWLKGKEGSSMSMVQLTQKGVFKKIEIAVSTGQVLMIESLG